ncbi:hypothetical protein BDV95DRAFT_617990 [Massariosphaeria phaeospora]|uniref:Uncharacterized protein n=1 Tax=Massariosphaeria phaeospora TaxID=100035 RepID=A0A7C8IAE5_9PLEO|nr:hypothetical protein BDV95DRAFT_617990 [Massariosphaeria phaeospora]
MSTKTATFPAEKATQLHHEEALSASDVDVDDLKKQNHSPPTPTPLLHSLLSHPSAQSALRALSATLADLADGRTSVAEAARTATLWGMEVRRVAKTATAKEGDGKEKQKEEMMKLGKAERKALKKEIKGVLREAKGVWREGKREGKAKGMKGGE